jgi:glycoprotein endo-alpha-1,2-mannosidase
MSEWPPSERCSTAVACASAMSATDARGLDRPGPFRRPRVGVQCCRLRRGLWALAAAAGFATLVAGTTAAAPIDGRPAAAVGDIAIFYYPWYGTPARDGAYLHWGQNGAAPPKAIASDFYPARGVYSSSDPAIVGVQLAEIASLGIGTVIVSWWGAGSSEDTRLPQVLASAHSLGLRVAIHIEPYPGRTPAGVAADIARLQAFGIADFYVYDPNGSASVDWWSAFRGLHGVRVFAQTDLPGRAAAGGFSGLYTYDVYAHDGSSFSRLCANARRLQLLCAPSVGPGYDARRATGDPRVRARLSGATYDRMWRAAIRSRADLVTITSYNEWHEGTQIEAAVDAGKDYESYDGAWGLHGTAAQQAYLARTAWWTQAYERRLAAGRSPQ